MIQTEFATTITSTIKYPLVNIDDKHGKQDAKFKEKLEETISDQDAEFDAEFEKQFHTLSLHIKEYSTKF